MNTYLGQADGDILGDEISDHACLLPHRDLVFACFFTFCIHLCIESLFLGYEVVRGFLCLQEPMQIERHGLSVVTDLLFGCDLFLYGIHLLAEAIDLIVHCPRYTSGDEQG